MCNLLKSGMHCMRRKLMKKDKIIRIYLWLSIIAMLAFMIVVVVFLQSLPVGETYQNGFFGGVEKTVITVVFEGSGYVEATNYPLVVAVGLFLITLITAFYCNMNGGLQKKMISEAMVYNVVITLLIVASTLLFVYMIPESVNGVVDNGFFFTKFPRLTDDVVVAYNLSYLLSVIYIVLNGLTLIITKEKQRPSKEEEYNEGDLFL